MLSTGPLSTWCGPALFRPVDQVYAMAAIADDWTIATAKECLVLRLTQAVILNDC